ncbi:MAG: OprD family outer membrane porin [Verrucomicrobiota bacterium]
MNRAAILPLFLFALGAFLGTSAFAAGLPEYLLVEEPLSDELEKARSPLEQLGKPFETLFFDETPLWEDLFEDSKQPFLDDAKLFPKPRFYYRLRDNGDGTESESAALGGAFGLQSGYYRKWLRIGITGYQSSKLYGPEDRDGAGLLSPGQSSYTVLGEAYAEITVHQTSLFSGLNLFNLPYINANDSRMTPNTFESYMLRSNDIPNLELGLGHIRSMRFRNSTDYENLGLRAGASEKTDGLSLIGARYAADNRFSIGFIGEAAWDLFHTFYFETTAEFNIQNDQQLQIAFQLTDQRELGKALLGEFSVQHWGAKTSLDLGHLILSSALSYTSDGQLQKPFGGSPSFNSLMISDFDRAEELAIRVSTLINLETIGLEGFTTSLNVGHGMTPEAVQSTIPDQTEFNINLDYRPRSKNWENLWLRLRYGENDRNSQISDFRIIANYSIVF